MPVYTVSQVARYLKDTLQRDALLGDLWVQGEVSNLRTTPTGHTFFTLKDATAALRCVAFNRILGSHLLEDGQEVLAYGRISFYEARGDVNFYVEVVRPVGTGALALEFARLKNRLEAEGLFARKRPLPPFPRRIGVVTSPMGAVWHDIQTTIRKRYPIVELVLAPCQVQGDGAADTIVEALEALAREPGIDLVIVARGGGSLEELWPFNEERVARAIFRCPFPVITGIGHETDTTIADLVADVRAPTPTAAAQQAVPDRTDLLHRIDAYWKRAQALWHRRLIQASQGLEALTARLVRCAPDTHAPRQQVDTLLRHAYRALERSLRSRRMALNALMARLEALNPRRVLERGYAVVTRRGENRPITHPRQVASGDALTVWVMGGAFGARAEG
ncbi:MAG: exodeoxyribonuclease VII large subunit [Dehalococcoidia bacterium]|nr:exodeoxyribonuclease VII large subunit [Dehalococcoidia bacterium]MDW8119178.1 exodeoxyribonuclease VII large subunit [Chloroflexota bacterium]